MCGFVVQLFRIHILRYFFNKFLIYLKLTRTYNKMVKENWIEINLWYYIVHELNTIFYLVKIIMLISQI